MTLTPTNSHGGASGGGAVTVADGADVTEGAIADAAIITNTTGTVSGKLRGIVALLAGQLKVGGSVASDAAVTDNPVLDGGRASSAIPTAVSADGDAVANWATRNGAIMTQLQTSAVGDDANGNNPFALYDTTATQRFLGSIPVLYDGQTFNKMRSNDYQSLLASAARTATTTTADQTNRNQIGVLLVVNVTAEAGVTTLTLTVQGKDSISGNYYDLITGLVVYAAATDTPPTTRAVVLYPGTLTADAIGIAGANGMVSKNVLLPRLWRATITPSDASSQTYSLSSVVIL